MNHLIKIFSALTALCTIALGQSYTVQPPNSGNICPMAIVNGVQSIPKLNIPFTFPAAPQGTTSVTFTYHRSPIVEWWVENDTTLPIGEAWYDFGVIDNWTYRPWQYHCQGSWTSGYWEEEGNEWEDHSDVPESVYMKQIQGSGISYHYGGDMYDIAAFDGVDDGAGPSGRNGTNVGGQWAGFNVAPSGVGFFKRADSNGNVTVNFAPRAVMHMDPLTPFPGHWYHTSYKWACNYNMHMSAVTISYGQ